RRALRARVRAARSPPGHRPKGHASDPGRRDDPRGHAGMTTGPPRVFVVVSARMASSRYPGKAVVPLAGRPLLAVLLERMAAAPGVDGVVLATSTLTEYDQLVRLVDRAGLPVFRDEYVDSFRRYVFLVRQVCVGQVV